MCRRRKELSANRASQNPSLWTGQPCAGRFPPSRSLRARSCFTSELILVYKPVGADLRSGMTWTTICGKNMRVRRYRRGCESSSQQHNEAACGSLPQPAGVLWFDTAVPPA